MIRHLLQGIFADPGRKLFALIIAVAAWLVVQGDEQHETQIQAAVEWTLPKGLVAVEPLPQQVGVRIRGTRTATRRASHLPVRLTVDITAMRPGAHEIDLASRALDGVSPSVEVVGLSPSAVVIALDEQITRKVRVDGATVGEPADGWMVGTASVEPGFVEFTGPRVLVSALKRAHTLPVDVTGLAQDTSVAVGLDLPRSVDADPPTVTVTVDLEAKAVRQVFTSVPVEVRGHPDWIPAVEVADLTLEGPSAALASLRPEDILVVMLLPEPPRRDRYVAAFGTDEGARLTAFVLGAPDVVAVALVPDEIEVHRP